MTPRSESQLLDAVMDVAGLYGWLVHHDRPARTANGWRTAIQGHAGFPDLVLARAGVVLFRELKGPKGRLSPEQKAWAGQLSFSGLFPVVGHEVNRQYAQFDVWTPADWDLIVATLSAPRKAVLTGV